MSNLILILLKAQGTSDQEYFLASESIITLIFNTNDSPEGLIRLLIKQMSEFLYLDCSSCDLFEWKLSQTLYVVSNSALKFLMHIDKL